MYFDGSFVDFDRFFSDFLHCFACLLAWTSWLTIHLAVSRSLAILATNLCSKGDRDDQSDVSVSSAHTSDLSDFVEFDQDFEIDASSSSSDENVDSDEEWVDVVQDFERVPFDSDVGPTMPLPVDAKPVD